MPDSVQVLGLALENSQKKEIASKYVGALEEKFAQALNRHQKPDDIDMNWNKVKGTIKTAETRRTRSEWKERMVWQRVSAGNRWEIDKKNNSIIPAQNLIFQASSVEF